MSPFGTFEFIDLCAAMEIPPVVTVFAELPPEAFGDLIEYAWGDAGTQLGRLRIEDGHPEPFNVTWFELVRCACVYASVQAQAHNHHVT